MTKLNEKEVLARSHATSLSNVRKLICWGSNLTDISIVREMVNLEILNVSVNNLTTLKDLSHCPRLKELYIRKNLVNSTDEIAFLKNLPQLTVLWINDNPISKIPNYRETVLCNLSSLLKLDSIQVSKGERDLASQHGQYIACDEILPDYEGLDLNHTLTINAVALHIEGNLRNESSVDEKLPSVIGNENVSCIRGFEGSKSLKEERRTSTYTSASTSKHSNTVNAIKLLLKDLDYTDLQDVNTYTQNLLKCADKKNVSNRSVNILED